MCIGGGGIYNAATQASQVKSSQVQLVSAKVDVAVGTWERCVLRNALQTVVKVVKDPTDRKLMGDTVFSVSTAGSAVAVVPR